MARMTINEALDLVTRIEEGGEYETTPEEVKEAYNRLWEASDASMYREKINTLYLWLEMWG